MGMAQARALQTEEAMTNGSNLQRFTGLALTLAIVVGATATAQAGGGKTSGIRTSGVTKVYSRPGPVVRDHRGQSPSGSPGSTSGGDAQVRDHRSGQHQFCFGALFGGTQCTQF